LSVVTFPPALMFWVQGTNMNRNENPKNTKSMFRSTLVDTRASAFRNDGYRLWSTYLLIDAFEIFNMTTILLCELTVLHIENSPNLRLEIIVTGNRNYRPSILWFNQKIDNRFFINLI
jgi:hypothetical protein